MAFKFLATLALIGLVAADETKDDDDVMVSPKFNYTLPAMDDKFKSTGDAGIIETYTKKIKGENGKADTLEWHNTIFVGVGNQIVWNDNKDKEMKAHIGILETGNTADWCTFKFKFNGEGKINVMETKDGNNNNAQKEPFKIDTNENMDCKINVAKSGPNTQEKYIVPKIHFMKPFKTGDGKDINLKVATNYTLFYQMSFAGKNI